MIELKHKIKTVFTRVIERKLRMYRQLKPQTETKYRKRRLI